MPQRKCAAKRLRVDKTKTLRNNRIKAELKKELKGLRFLINSGKLEEAKGKLGAVYATLDRASAKGILHKNTAARHKSSLARKLKTA